jgi:tetratricopeptide (TPR) repeat protein
MPNRSTDALFQLVKSLEKSEKRNFKLYVNRNSGDGDLKVVQLFDALDKMDVYDEELLLKKNKGIKKQQLSNSKAHLYKQILTSLRLIKNEENIDIQLHEQMDHARILYNKGLYLQSLKVLDKLKELGRANQQYTYLQQAIFFEQKIEALHITRSMQDRAEALTRETDEVNGRLVQISKLSNLSLLLYSWYIKNGHARNENDEKAVQKFFDDHLPPEAKSPHGFYEKLYKYQSYSWYGFIRQDFLMYYRNTQKWVDLFEQYPNMLAIETSHYIKGMHNLVSAHFDLQNYEKFNESLDQFEKFASSSLVKNNENNKIQCFVYVSTALINKHFIEGTFTQGTKLVPNIIEKLEEYEIYLDRHRILVFYYKIACLYFGSGNNEKAIDYLNKIINWKVDLRTDLQCYARLLHLIAHYELGNYDLLEYLTKSVYRFMAKMKNLSSVEEEMFKFLRQAFSFTPRQMQPAFEKLLNRVKQYERNRFETRAFAYLDIVSWLESKIKKVAVQDVIRERYLHHLEDSKGIKN